MGCRKGIWGAIKANEAPLWDRQCTQDKAMKPSESGNEPVALSQMKGKEPMALSQMKGNEPVAFKPIEMAMNPWH